MHPRKTECGCPSGGGIKNGHVRYPYCGGTQKKRMKKRRIYSTYTYGTLNFLARRLGTSNTCLCCYGSCPPGEFLKQVWRTYDYNGHIYTRLYRPQRLCCTILLTSSPVAVTHKSYFTRCFRYIPICSHTQVLCMLPSSQASCI